MKEEQGNTVGKKANNKKMIILICVFVVIVAGLVAVIVSLLLRKPEQKTETNEIPPTIVDEDNAEEVLQDIEDNTAKTQFRCRMTTDWNFADGKSESKDAYIANADTNHYPMYFEVRLVDSNEVIYTSPTIPVGSELNGLKLEQELSKGDHDAEVIYHLIDTENNNEEVSTVSFTVVIHVLG